jgi:beta-1,3-galactosyltransferase 1
MKILLFSSLFLIICISLLAFNVFDSFYYEKAISDKVESRKNRILNNYQIVSYNKKPCYSQEFENFKQNNPIDLKQSYFLNTTNREIFGKSNLETLNRQFKIDNQEELINPHNFTFILSPGVKVCAEKELLLIVMVPTRAENFTHRNFIRSSWGNHEIFSSMRVVFLLGETKNEIVQNDLELESAIYGDLVQENFIDSYYNLTLKTVMGLRWVSEYCSNAKFFLKVDSDVVVNPLFLLNFLNEINKKHELKNSFLCNRGVNKKPYRSKKSKFLISTDIYEPKKYPFFCDGQAYLMTNDLAINLFNRSQYVKPFVLEDVNLGIVALSLNSTFIHIKEFYGEKFRRSNIFFGRDLIHRMLLFSTNDIHEYGLFWVYVQEKMKQFFPFITF